MTEKSPNEAQGNSTRSHQPSSYRQEEQVTVSASLRPSRSLTVVACDSIQANGWPFVHSWWQVCNIPLGVLTSHNDLSLVTEKKTVKEKKNGLEPSIHAGFKPLEMIEWE